MPGIVRTRTSIDSEEREEISEDSSDPDDVPRRLSNPNKRPRLSDGTSDKSRTSSPSDASAASQRAAGRNERHTPRPTPLSQRSLLESSPATTLKPGQLVRVSLRNFVTYKSVTFYPGPNLNMIIGPNGTGKSTLVCAICIGLGWDTKHLGRAKELSEYIKHGCSDAYTEIELQGEEGQANPIIKLDIAREGDNNKTWHLNGQRCRAKDVADVTKRFDIQIDNLCQFLPQDRVVEFSKMDPQTLLSSTQRAAAPPHMIEWHEQLKTLRSEQRAVEKEENAKRAHLANLENRQASARGDVERMRERAEVLHTVDMLERIRPLIQYGQAKNEFITKRVERDSVRMEHASLSASLEPQTRAATEKNSYVQKVESVVKQRKRMLDRQEADAKSCQETQQKTADAIEQCKGERRAAIKTNTKSKQKRQEAQRKIHDIKTQMKQDRIDIDTAWYNEQVRAKKREMSELKQEEDEITSTSRARLSDIEERRRRIQNAKQSMTDLTTQAGQQENKLKSLAEDAWTAWEWIQKNKSSFKGEVYGPPIVSCSVKDVRYAPLIEAAFNKADFCRFTTTHPDDWQFLQVQLHDRLRLFNVNICRVVEPLTAFQAPVDVETMRGMGLEGWALDYMEGPDAVLAMLCENVSLHRTGIAWRESSEEQYAMLEQSNVQQWTTSKSSYRITRRREYGPSATSTQVKDIKQTAQIWGSQAVDTMAESNFRRIIAELASECEELESHVKEDRAKVHDLRTQEERLRREKESLEDEKSDKQKFNSTLAALPAKLANEETKLKEMEAAELEHREQLKVFDRQHEQLALKRGQQAIDYARRIENLSRMHADYVTASIALIEAQSDHAILVARHKDATTRLEQMAAKLESLRKEVKEAQAKARELQMKWTRVRDGEEGVADWFEEHSEEVTGKTPDELEVEIESQRARLEVLHAGNPQATAQFEKRAKDIERLEAELAGATNQTQELHARISEVREQWEPELDALVAKISTAFAASFAKIGCVGSVEISKPGTDESQEGNDYEKWAIQILVRFRDEGSLHVLDPHRQSGGERAVTTIFYLMALQSLSRAPFRVVDEINQGMDPRNERIVHERMVDIACGRLEEGGGGSQYFLITPKLLGGLKYARGMRVHNIASGEFMMPDLSFQESIRSYKAMVSGPRAASSEIEAF